MKPEIHSANNLWYIDVVDLVPRDIIIAKLLDIDYDTYIKILKKHGAHLDYGNSEYWFKTREQVEVVIKTLESHYILSKLTK